MGERLTASDILGHRFPVLDCGYVELQDFMGSDLAIVNAARVSFLGESKGPERDKKLLFWLIERRHTSPFEMAVMRLRIKCPLFVARQWMRHRMWSYNEVSRRYTEENLEFHIPTVWRAQSADNKQCSDGDSGADFSSALQAVIDLSMTAYNAALNSGIAREQARMLLPQCMYTEFVAKVDAHNLMHFLTLRMAPDAQEEIRVYGEVIYREIFARLLPWTAEAFERFGLKKGDA